MAPGWALAQSKRTTSGLIFDSEALTWLNVTGGSFDCADAPPRAMVIPGDEEHAEAPFCDRGTRYTGVTAL